jgi:uncharacterized membrane protein YdfJ with MMPL/SSD domain
MKLPYNWNRALAGLLLLAVLFASADYYLELGVFGRSAKLVMILVLFVIALYGAFVMPTRQEMQDHGRAKEPDQAPKDTVSRQREG